MSKPTLQIEIARPEDARTWAELGFPPGVPPATDMLTGQINAFNAPAPDIDESRFIVWIDDKPAARASFNQLQTVIELRDFNIADGYINDYGAAILESIASAARPRGDILTVDFFPASYSRSFLGAGFKQNSRTRMMKSLTGYVPMPVVLPDGITLRNLINTDERAMAELAYNNYTGTADQEMVSSSRAQTAAIMKAMIHNDYNLLIPTGSYLAVERAEKLDGSVILGDASRNPYDPLAWVMDISIAPAMRGKGLGKALLLSAINAAHSHDYPCIGLIVTIGNMAAQTLYRSLGFEEYGDVMYEGFLKLR